MFKFNQHNKTEMNLIRHLVYGEGLIRHDAFLEIANKTLLSRYKAANLIRQKPDAEKGVYMITDKFKQCYKSQIEPRHAFSGSGSMKHSEILHNIIKILPRDVHITSGETLKQELEQLQKTAEYQQKERILREEYREQREICRNEVREAPNAMERYEALTRFNLYNRLSSMDKLCSAADMRVSLNREQVDQLLTTLFDRHLNEELTQREERFVSHAIRTLQQIQTNSTETITEVLIEAVSDSYGTIQIEQKLNTSSVLSTPIIFFSE